MYQASGCMHCKGQSTITMLSNLPNVCPAPHSQPHQLKMVAVCCHCVPSPYHVLITNPTQKIRLGNRRQICNYHRLVITQFTCQPFVPSMANRNCVAVNSLCDSLQRTVLTYMHLPVYASTHLRVLFGKCF